jgi:restriction modification system DNA specificity domain protein
MVKIKLGDVIDFKNGKSIKKSDGVIPIYGGNGILGYTNKSNFSHTIVVGRVGAYCGSIHVEENLCWVSDNAIAGVPKEGQDLTYLYYVLKSLNLNSKQIGSSQPLITQSMLKDMIVDIEIDIEKQKIIANSISIIDQKIQINNQINQELEAMAKTLYDYWFVQFDFPDQNGKPYKSSGGKMVYHPELKREIPEGWGVRILNEVLDLISGYPFSSNDYVTSGKYKLYTIKNVQDGYTVDKVDNYLDFLPSNMSHECQLRRGDLIMSLTGNVGRVGMVYEDDVLLNQRVLKLNPINKTHKSFIYSFFRSDVTKAHLENMSTGTSQKNLSPIDIGNMMIPFPSESLLSKFLDNLKMLENNLVESQQLTQLRDWLLPMLMNGQVKVE